MKYNMNMKNLVLATLITGLLASSCTQVTDKAKEEAQKMVSQTNEKGQEVIDELGLVYVEEGAQDIITYEEVNAAQQAWCDALVKIGQLKKEGGDYRSFAEQVLSDVYDYDNGEVFFKPRLAFGDQTFRNDKKGAFAYFIDGDPEYPNEKGFAMAPWVKARYDNAGEKNEGIQIYGTVASPWGMCG